MQNPVDTHLTPPRLRRRRCYECYEEFETTLTFRSRCDHCMVDWQARLETAAQAGVIIATFGRSAS